MIQKPVLTSIKTTIKSTGIFLFAITASMVTPSCDNTGNERIQPWPENPYYWQYKGEPVILIGGSDDDNLFQWDKEALTAHLDLLASVGGNFIRNTMSSRKPGNHDPFLKLENGLYDLDQWNPVYWQKFEDLLALSQERNIIVQIEFWDMHDWYEGEPDPNLINFRWKHRSMNPANNINYTAEESGLPDEIDFDPLYGKANEHPFFQTHLPEKNLSIARSYQEKFIKKVIEVSANYPNVLYCINNESAHDISWSLSWLDFAKKTAAGINMPIYVGDMLMIATSSLVTEHGFDFADISQSASGLHRPQDSNVREGHFETLAGEVDRLANNPAPVNSVKQYGGDIRGWTRGSNEGIERVWRSIFGGQAGARFHRPPSGQGLNEKAQTNIKSLRMITDHFDLKTVKPHQKLSHLFLKRESNAAYLMGHEGEVMAVFFTSTGKEVEIDISSLKGSAKIQWINTNSAEWSDSQSHSGNSVMLVKPGDGQWVALISNEI